MLIGRQNDPKKGYNKSKAKDVNVIKQKREKARRKNV
jgi:hypothetical protein